MRYLPILGLLVGCVDGGLLSADAIERLYEKPPIPVDPHWQARWFTGSGLALGCDLFPAEVIDVDSSLGGVYATPPRIDEPPLWLQDVDYSWAVAMLILVNPEAVVLPDVDVDGVGVRLEFGAWGAVTDRALVYGTGNLDLFADAWLLPLEVTDDIEAFDGLWMGLLSQNVYLTGEIQGALYGLIEEDSNFIEEEGVEVTAGDWMSESAEFVYSGEALGGVQSGCVTYGFEDEEEHEEEEHEEDQ